MADVTGRPNEPPTEVCDRCGGVAARPATARERFARWLVNGSGAGRWRYCANCGAAWSGGSRYTMRAPSAGGRWRRWWRIPRDVYAGLRAARTWHPMPLFYVTVGAVALVPALGIATLSPRPWWPVVVLVPIAAVAVTWAWSMATALGRARREVRWRIAPDRAWREELDEELEALRDQLDGFALLVPANWSGVCSLDGAAWSMPPRAGRILEQITTVADQGDPQLDPARHDPGWRPATPQIEVRTTREPWGVVEEHAISEFVDRATMRDPADLDGVDPDDHAEVERRLHALLRARDADERRWRQVLDDRWRTGTVQVDGAPTTAQLLTHPDTDVEVAVFTHRGQHLLAVTTGLALDGLTLREVTDPNPLIEEFTRRRQRSLAPPPV